MITQEYLKELLHYNPDTGIFTWNISRSNKVKVNGIAGDICRGYARISIDGRKYFSHRLAYLYMAGFMPNQVDHKDGNPSNNIWTNLREATVTQNRMNSSIGKRNSSGIKNVYWHELSKSWMVRVALNRKTKYLGIYKDIELAELVAIEARNKYHGEFARHV